MDTGNWSSLSRNWRNNVLMKKNGSLSVKSNTFNVELLNENNYQAWKFKMKILLEERNPTESINKEFVSSDYPDGIS